MVLVENDLTRMMLENMACLDSRCVAGGSRGRAGHLRGVRAFVDGEGAVWLVGRADRAAGDGGVNQHGCIAKPISGRSPGSYRQLAARR